MSILVQNDRNFALSNRYFSYVISVEEQDILRQKYYGPPLAKPWEVLPVNPKLHRELSSSFEGIKNLNLNEALLEYPTYGRSDYRLPAFHAQNSDGNSIFSFHYKSYKILKDKPELKGLPSARGGDSETLMICLEDQHWNITLELRYTIYEHYGVLAKSSRFLNKGMHDITIQRLASSSIGLPAKDYELLHFYGTWSREFNEERINMPRGRFVIDSSRGSSSAAHNPFLAVMEKETSEDHGHVYASTLVYSGNFAISAEKGEFEDVRIIAGINPFDFRWNLKAGQQIDTPEALHVFSENGLTGMSHQWHQFIRDRISPARFKNESRPSFLNTWEACYFDVNAKKILELADQAIVLGVEMLVLDDGWFKGRNDDTSSLGDWEADKKKFPSGIEQLAKDVQAKGLKFGLWFEPEMVNPESDLYRNHPDWILHVPARKSSLGRNQLTLDLSQSVVGDYLFEKISEILSCGFIDYVKWDMNRCMTEIGSNQLPAIQQGEIAHRYILGLYALLDKLTKAFPSILFENCASGGNRFDLGMLSFFPQTWTSDMCDPIGRLEIVNGASYLFPNDVMAAYIGPSPNHQNGRISSIKSRYLAGFFCASRGISLDIPNLEKEEIDKIKEYIAFTNFTSQEMLGGSFYRLLKEPHKFCWQFITSDASKVYLLYFHILAATNMSIPRVRLKGLNSKSQYYLKQEDLLLSGDTLMKLGFELPFLTNAPNIAAREVLKRDFVGMLYEFQIKDTPQ